MLFKKPKFCVDCKHHAIETHVTKTVRVAPWSGRERTHTEKIDKHICNFSKVIYDVVTGTRFEGIPLGIPCDLARHYSVYAATDDILTGQCGPDAVLFQKKD